MDGILLLLIMISSAGAGWSLCNINSNRKSFQALRDNPNIVSDVIEQLIKDGDLKWTEKWDKP